MNVASIFLDPKSLEETSGYYGLVAVQRNSVSSQCVFTEQYVSKSMLVDELQDRLNAIANAMVQMPPEADLSAITSEWTVVNDILKEVKVL